MDLPENLKTTNWTISSGKLTKNFIFKTFSESIDFVNRLAFLAESKSHHPEIEVRFNKVRVLLWTHSENKITDKDFAMAEELNHLV